jgi:RNA polymerase sigma-70 factor (ECF subfamily)
MEDRYRRLEEQPMDQDTTAAGTEPRDLDGVWRDDRRHLLGLATRMLGDAAEAEDVVQDAFGRLARVELTEILDVRGWLAVVVRRLCLDRIKSARSRHALVGGSGDEGSDDGTAEGDPADRVTLDEQVQLALAVVLDRLSPAERTSFVLHDVFGFSFAAVAEIVGRTPAACRQLASRARRSIQADPTNLSSGTKVTPQGLVAERFVAACAGGDIAELVAVLDPEVAGVATLLGGGTLAEVVGRPAVAERLLAFFGPSTDMELVAVPVEDDASIVAFQRGQVAAIIRLEVRDDLVHHITSWVRFPR